MTVSVNLTEYQMKVMLRYAEISNMTMDKLMDDIIEKIEDELDAKLGDEAYERYLEDPKETSHEDVMKEFGLK